MPQQIVPQFDVGAATINSLSALSPIMAALSADNVAPTAVSQLLQLGSHFYISGPRMEQVSDLLQRTSSTRLDRLGTLIGWKKGDTASYMAQTPGGLSIALLCLCLENMSCNESGGVLYDVSERILPKGEAVSSVRQLAALSHLISKKVAALGYGNVLAEQGSRICAVYEYGPGTVPNDLHDSINRESFVEVLTAVSRVFSEDSCQIRITGTCGMAWILATLIIMFPNDLTVVADSTILHKGMQQLILLDMTPREETRGPVVVEIEHKIQTSPQSRLSLNFEPEPPIPHHYDLTYHWSGHLRSFLEVCFTSAGLKCSEELVLAFCDEMVHLLAQQDYARQARKERPPHTRFPRGGITGKMGVNKNLQVRQTCLEILEVEPSGKHADESSAFSTLLQCFQRCVRDTQCACKKREDFGLSIKNWETRSWEIASPRLHPGECPVKYLWEQVGLAMIHGVCCFFLKAFGPVVIAHAYIADGDAVRLRIVKGQTILWIDCDEFYEAMMHHLSADDPTLAWHHMSSTVFPAALIDMSINVDRCPLFMIVDGHIIMTNHYYDQINPGKSTGRDRITPYQSRDAPKTDMIPCAAGVHSDMQFTFVESSYELELRAQLFASGQSIRLNWREVLIASMGVVDGTPCDHPPLAPVNSNKLDKIWETSAIAPLAPGEKVGVVQTYRSPLAQLVACCPGHNALLQRRCCLNCAIEEALGLELKMIIVAC